MSKMRASIGFSDELWQKITVGADKRGITKAGLVNMAMIAFLAKDYYAVMAFKTKEEYENHKRIYAFGQVAEKWQNNNKYVE